MRPWRTIILMLVVVNPLAALLYPVIFGGHHSWRQFGVSYTVSNVAFLLCYGFVLFVRRFTQKRAFMIGAPLVMLPGATYAGLATAGAIFGFEPPDLYGMRGSLLIAVVFLAVFTSVQTYTNLRLKAQVAALTAQMNPHFLFNALNTIASLTQSDARAAETMTLRLAELYRRVLDATRSEKHTLREELSLCRAYLEIEQARFGERLRFQIDEGDNRSCPPLSIQPLVENAVKHGLGPLPEGGTVWVRVGKSIVVEDSGVGFTGEKPTSTALANLRQRVRLQIMPRPGGGTIVSVRL